MLFQYLFAVWHLCTVMQHVAVILPACVCRVHRRKKPRTHFYWNCEICMQLKVLTAFPSPSSHAASSNQSFPRATGVFAMSRNQITETGFAQLAKKRPSFRSPCPWLSSFATFGTIVRLFRKRSLTQHSRLLMYVLGLCRKSPRRCR